MQQLACLGSRAGPNAPSCATPQDQICNGPVEFASGSRPTDDGYRFVRDESGSAYR